MCISWYTVYTYMYIYNHPAAIGVPFENGWPSCYKDRLGQCGPFVSQNGPSWSASAKLTTLSRSVKKHLAHLDKANQTHRTFPPFWTRFKKSRIPPQEKEKQTLKSQWMIMSKILSKKYPKNYIPKLRSPKFYHIPSYLFLQFPRYVRRQPIVSRYHPVLPG